MKIQKYQNNTIELFDAEQLLNQTTNPTLEPYKVDIVKDNVLANEKYYLQKNYHMTNQMQMMKLNI